MFEHASLLAKVREPSNGEHSYGEGATSPRSGIVMCTGDLGDELALKEKTFHRVIPGVRAEAMQVERDFSL